MPNLYDFSSYLDGGYGGGDDDYSFDPRKLRQQTMFSQFAMPDPQQGAPSTFGTPVNQDPDPTNRGGFTPLIPPPTQNQTRNDPIPFKDTTAGPQGLTSKDLSMKELMDMVNQVYTPEFTARNRLDNLLNNFPERKAPSFGRALVAAGMGFGHDPKTTLDVQDRVMNAPWMRDVSAWKEKTQPFYNAAQLENQGNVNERTLAGNLVTAKVNTDRIAEQARNADQKNAIAQIRADAYAWKARHPDWKFDFSGPTAYAYAPDGSQRVPLGATGSLSDADKIDLQGQWNVKAAEARAQGQIANTRAGDAGIFKDNKSGALYYVNPSDNSITPITPNAPPQPSGQLSPANQTPPTVKPPTLKEVQDNQQLTLGQIYNSGRQEYANLIKKNNDETYSEKPRPESGFFAGDQSANQKRWDEIHKALYPNYQPPAPPLPTGKQPPVASPIPGLNPQGSSSSGGFDDSGSGSGAAIRGVGAAATQNSADTLGAIMDAANQSGNPPKEITATSPDKTTKLKSTDGGKTWSLKSLDGGKTWVPNR